ncbi:hypothetical protein PINS_up007010 [Pythium insidiosum]|nr:hypothetical protein PINS_up007010 [Pythium insidiosum]
MSSHSPLACRTSSNHHFPDHDPRPSKALDPTVYRQLLIGYEHQLQLLSVTSRGFKVEWSREHPSQRVRPANLKSATRLGGAIERRIREGVKACTYQLPDTDVLDLSAVHVFPFGAVWGIAEDVPRLAMRDPRAHINQRSQVQWLIKLRALALDWDATTHTVAIPPEKVAKGLQRLCDARRSVRRSVQSLQQLIGSLGHVDTCLRAARPFYQRLHAVCAR